MSTDYEHGASDPQTYAIIGACMAVHSELGPGFLESVYQEALAIELTRRGIPFVAEKPIPIDYCGVRLVTHFDADFLCYDEIIVELKAVAGLATPHHAIIINFLKATSCERGLLINFGASRLEYKRFILSHHLRESASSADKSEELSADDADGRR
jgi:GxxExxY protein